MKAAADDGARRSRRRVRLVSALALAACTVGVAACSTTSESSSTSAGSGSAVSDPAGSTPSVTGGGSASGPGAGPSTGPDGSSSPTAGTTDAAASTTTGPTASTAPPTTTTTLPPTTTLPLFTQGGVVIVANASGVTGAAAAMTATLGGLGFQTVQATNAAGYEDSLDVSKVYFAPDAYPVAYSLAQLLGGVQVAPMPTPPPIFLALEGLRGANVIVMLGTDRAGQPLPGRA